MVSFVGGAVFGGLSSDSFGSFATIDNGSIVD